MIIINDFFVRYKEAVSNQMELISKRNNGKIISATRFMGQKPLQEQDKQDNIYVYRPFIYFLKAIKEVKKNSKDTVHVFEEEPSVWKRILFNSSDNPLFVSMYRRPNKKYAEHLKKYKNLKRVFVELEKHKEILIQYGIQENKIMVTPTPSKIPRKKSNKEFNPSNVNILFASWNNKEGDAIRERGLEYLLQLLKENTNFSLTIPLRDNDTQAFEQMAKKLGVWDRVSLLDIHNNTDTLINLFDNSDFVAFVPQKRIVKDVPNSLIDGLVRGKPVIISDVIDFSETVSYNNIGYVISKGEKAHKMDISIDEYAEMSERAYKYSEVHSQENYINIIEKGYGIEKKNNSEFKEKIKVSGEMLQNQCIENREVDKRKIAIINPWAISGKSIGGTERFVMDLGESLKMLGNEIDVYMFSGENHKERNINYININLFEMQGEADEYIIQDTFGNFETEESYNELAKKIENKIDVSKYDCIHLNSQLFLQAWKEKNRIFTIHTNPFEYELAWGKKSFIKMLELMKKYKNNKFTTFVAPSKYYAKEYEKLTDCSIKYIPHAIDINRLYTKNSKENIIEKYNLNRKKIRILVPSRLEPMQKQPMLVIEACALLGNEIKDKIEIVFTGLDKQYIKFVQELQDKAKNKNLDIKIIRFDKMSEAYKIADLTVLPSRSESFGYSALESLSLGIPTILNNIPTFKEIADGNNNALIFDKSAVELKNRIQEVIISKKYEERNLPNDKWSEKYNLNTFAKNYFDLIS